MKATSRPPISSDWRDIASLGEQIVSATSLSEQRDRIVAVTSRLLKGQVDVWLHEHLFRLPNLSEGNLFPDEPEFHGMQRAIKAGDLRTKQKRAETTDASRATWAAVPLEDQGMGLGALQVTRPKGP